MQLHKSFEVLRGQDDEIAISTELNGENFVPTLVLSVLKKVFLICVMERRKWSDFLSSKHQQKEYIEQFILNRLFWKLWPLQSCDSSNEDLNVSLSISYSNKTFFNFFWIIHSYSFIFIYICPIHSYSYSFLFIHSLYNWIWGKHYSIHQIIQLFSIQYSMLSNE